MKFRAIFPIMFLVFIQGFSQGEASDEKVRSYLGANGSEAQYDFAYDQLLQMMRQSYPKKDTNAKGWEYLENNKKQAVDEMMALLLPIYQRHFNVDEIDQMTRFYLSDAGQQLMKDRSLLTGLQKEKIDQFYTTEVGKKIIEKQQVLSQEISQASELWSRNLYETAVSLLKNE